MGLLKKKKVEKFFLLLDETALQILKILEITNDFIAGNKYFIVSLIFKNPQLSQRLKKWLEGRSTSDVISTRGTKKAESSLFSGIPSSTLKHR